MCCGLLGRSPCYPLWRHCARRETDKHGQVLPLDVVEWDPPRKLVGRISGPKLPLGGTWTYVIAPVEEGSWLTLTDDGEIYNSIFRFMARFFFGYSGTIEEYLRALGRKFAEEVKLEIPGES